MSGDRVTGSVIVPRTAITVGERVREDYGDISRLAASLKEWGQLVPIIVDTELKLCDGGRRLRALAEADIPDVLVLMREMTEAERRELEFEIDREHKPFNDLERSQAYVRKAVEAQQALNAKAEKEATNAPRVSPKTGRSAPRKQVTRKKVADAAGLELRTIQRAEQHVANVKKFPDLADKSTKEANREARKREMAARPDAAERKLEADDKHERARLMKSYKTGTGHVLELTRLKPEELAGAIPPDMWAQHERVEVEAQRWFDAVRRARQGGMRVVS